MPQQVYPGTWPASQSRRQIATLSLLGLLAEIVCPCTSCSCTITDASHYRYANRTEQDVVNLIEAKDAKKTKKTIQWAVKTFLDYFVDTGARDAAFETLLKCMN